MNYPSELQQIIQEIDAEELSRRNKQRCIVSENGGCYCTGRCMYTKEGWQELEDVKQKVKFTGVDEMKNKITDSQGTQ